MRRFSRRPCHSLMFDSRNSTCSQRGTSSRVRSIASSARKRTSGRTVNLPKNRGGRGKREAALRYGIRSSVPPCSRRLAEDVDRICRGVFCRTPRTPMMRRKPAAARSSGRRSTHSVSLVVSRAGTIVSSCRFRGGVMLRTAGVNRCATDLTGMSPSRKPSELGDAVVARALGGGTVTIDGIRRPARLERLAHYMVNRWLDHRNPHLGGRPGGRTLHVGA
jgi:hypothetical protein